MNGKILFIGNTSSSAVNFRTHLFSELLKKNYDLYLICGDNFRKAEIEEIGVKFLYVPFKNRSLNLFSFKMLIKKFRKAIREISPDLIFTYQLKANIFGSIAAAKEKKKYLCLNEGLGDGFGNNKTLKGKIIRKLSIYLHKKSIKNALKFLVSNEDDKSFFVENKICEDKKIKIVKPVGINCSIFKPTALPKQFSVLNVSRLIKTKGIIDYCEIAKIVRKKDPSISFKLLGPFGDLNYKDIIEYINNGDIIYLGEANDVKPYYLDASIIVLPSYREGFGLTLAEGAAMGRPSIAYNVTGPKSFVINEKTGYLVEYKNLNEFADKILYLKNNQKLLNKMSENSINNVLENYEISKTDKKIIDEIEECLLSF